MDPATRDHLVLLAAELGEPLSPAQVNGLARYQELLAEWNSKVNLTSVVEPRGVVELHFIDSLAVLHVVGNAETLIDVGAGAGFPGAVVAFMRPELAVVCLEAVQKKVAFMRAVGRELAPNLDAVWGRLEAFTENGRRFDVAVSRAVWDPAEWVERGASLVKPGGRLVAMQGSEQPALNAPAGFLAGSHFDYRAGRASRRLVVFERA